MSAFTANHTVGEHSVSSSTKQNTSKQDFVKTGKAIDENNMDYKYIVVADGHGSGKNKDMVINFIREYDWDRKLKNKNWYETFTLEFDEILSKTIGVGSTMSVIRIYCDRFECWWIGDSSTRIYENGEEIWRSVDHDASNREEHKRLIPKGYNLKPEHKPCVLTPTTIIMTPTFRVIMGPKDRIAMTRCLGHNNLTGNDIEFVTIPREESKNYKLIAASDGFWDLVCNTDTPTLSNREYDAEQLMHWISDRWHQEWTYFHSSGNQKITFPDWNVDDICVGVFMTQNP